jgi:hypothetical protein
MDKSETMELLKQHLFDNLVVDRMDDTPRFYRQTKVHHLLLALERSLSL